MAIALLVTRFSWYYAANTTVF